MGIHLNTQKTITSIDEATKAVLDIDTEHLDIEETILTNLFLRYADAYQPHMDTLKQEVEAACREVIPNGIINYGDMKVLLITKQKDPDQISHGAASIALPVHVQYNGKQIVLQATIGVQTHHGITNLYANMVREKKGPEWNDQSVSVYSTAVNYVPIKEDHGTNSKKLAETPRHHHKDIAERLRSDFRPEI